MYRPHESLANKHINDGAGDILMNLAIGVVGSVAGFVTDNQDVPKAALSVLVAAEPVLDGPEDLTGEQWLKSACTHTGVRMAAGPVIDQDLKHLLPLPCDQVILEGRR